MGSAAPCDMQLQGSAATGHPTEKSEERNKIGFSRSIRAYEDIDLARLKAFQIPDRRKTLDAQLAKIY